MSSISLADGFGHVDLSESSSSLSWRVSFGYSGLCIGPTPAGGDDDFSPSRNQILNDDSAAADPTCIGYEAVTLSSLSQLPVGAHVVSAAAAQLGAADFTGVIAGNVLTMFIVLAMLLHNRRATVMCCCGGRDAVKGSYAWTTRIVVLFLGMGLPAPSFPPCC